MDIQVDNGVWFPDAVHATAIRADVPCYPSLCLWAGENGDSLPELELQVDAAFHVEGDNGAACGCNLSADWGCSEGVTALGRGPRCGVVWHGGYIGGLPLARGQLHRA